MHKPDVAVDRHPHAARRTRTRGSRAAREIRERYPGVGVLLLSQYVEPGYAMALLETSAEGVGYLLKDRVVGPRAVRHGRAPRRRRRLGARPGRRQRARRAASAATTRSTSSPPREREVLELMAEGRSNQAIAERLFVTLRAVEKHVTSIFTKLGLPASTDDHRRVLAVLAYLRG